MQQTRNSDHLAYLIFASLIGVSFWFHRKHLQNQKALSPLHAQFQWQAGTNKIDMGMRHAVRLNIQLTMEPTCADASLAW